MESIKTALPNSFVYYVPKDIVSGDFYFFNAFSKKEAHPGRKEGAEEAGLFIAAADCTGHGVPGALMSMIVHEKLENATKYHGEPSEILHSINKQVKDALKQHQTDASRDGCDIALCKIQGNTLSYAGAYRPLYLFYKNGEFVEIKATKTAIAGLTPYDQKFEQHQFDTTELKAVYMFSDGFADQFGGQKSKKLTTKKFKELLHTIVNLPINEQNSQLETFFTNWRGNVEQIDDVLVIGITFP
ncbi:MAG: SpoIIE family protein phosphatase [Sphingobacteriaceae bacterium]|nr:SpoIIE family protein phosphatase [Sphingobacteriaceae bacterium]